ncbi:dihydroxyacetone kinase subunit DhaL [Pseudarthrobacter polychromogenes]|uniref:Dihydroxyacetone kinase subunit L n=1 Tax=Pseudarthrobacter polychromogenes TaxID=1676 RepID=A0ABQ1Y0N9_9MICC|nr:dihydroxyacetone kinase subunit DhaL [Pseudarthrobacter polychromogenes]GGH08020.1 dihydroxyacetone kinase subunit L [Pseudarthrobacter polychromogenes]
MSDSLTMDAIQQWLHRFALEITTQADWLTELDSAIGDADHGTNMVRGTGAVVAKLNGGATGTVQELLKAVGMTLVSSVGGASGSLYGTFFLEMGRNSPSGEQLNASELEKALRAGVDGVVARGHAAVGDKTMVDALEPAVTALYQSLANGLRLHDSVAAAAAAATTGRDSTEPLVARKGRASYLGERSAGHIDPGAASSAILVAALAATVGEGTAQ